MNTRDMLGGECQQMAAGMPVEKQLPEHSRHCLRGHGRDEPPARPNAAHGRPGGSPLPARCRILRDVEFRLASGLTARLEAELEADVISVKGRTALIGLTVDISDIELINHPPEHVAE